MNAFKQYIINNYSLEQLSDMADYGCSGGVNGLIYYTETDALYKQYCTELHEILGDYESAIGEKPRYVTAELGDYVRFTNAVVWFCAEWIARQAVDDAEHAANELAA